MSSVIFVLFLCLTLIVGLLVWIFKSPFEYPYRTITFDISGKRSPSREDLLDRYINKHGITPFVNHCEYVKQWKNECENKISNGSLKNIREKQYLKCIDDKHMFQFKTVRSQTRYRQVNYVKTSYHVDVVVARFSYDLSYIQNRYNALKDIGFGCTISEYNSKDQRKRMTKALRTEIAVRDNYTCQICGKYMPDSVGLQIDHIVPVAKGGKSVPSNLQVLCSKCNGKKSSN